MSDIQSDDKPWNLISDARDHRCQPTGRKLGAFFDCDCGTTYQLCETRLGRQWLPISEQARTHARNRTSRVLRGFR